MTTGPKDAGVPQAAPGQADDAREMPGSDHASHNPGPGSGHGHGAGLPFKLPFLEELKRRNVVRVALLYLLVCWLILEPKHVVFNMLEVPVWANRLVLVIMAIGFPAVVLFDYATSVLVPVGPPGGSDRHAQEGDALLRKLKDDPRYTAAVHAGHLQ